MSYAKLYSFIVRSSLWLYEPPYVRVLFITMLAIADRDGVIDGTGGIPGLADTAKLSPEETEDALRRLMSPDPLRPDQEYEGRRVAALEDGWALLNYPKYRDRIDKEERREQVRRAVAKFRAKPKKPCNQGNRGNTSTQLNSTELNSTERKNGNDPIRSNPLVGDRPEREKECLALVRELAGLTGEDPAELMAFASAYEGAKRQKLNPAAMTDDRLLATVLDLRKSVATERKKRGTTGRV